jgi:hypothetical protein
MLAALRSAWPLWTGSQLTPAQSVALREQGLRAGAANRTLFARPRAPGPTREYGLLKWETTRRTSGVGSVRTSRWMTCAALVNSGLRVRLHLPAHDSGRKRERYVLLVRIPRCLLSLGSRRQCPRRHSCPTQGTPMPPFEGYDHGAQVRLGNRGQVRFVDHRAESWARALGRCRSRCADKGAVHPAGRRSLPGGAARVGAAGTSGSGGEVIAGAPAVGSCRAALG